jgi:hypothetical protein
MPLTSFLYRCPACGATPMGEEREAARCPGCRRRYLPGPGHGLIVEVFPDGARKEVPAAALAVAMEARGGPGRVPGAGEPFQEARVRFRRATGEDAIRHDGELLGFAERLGAVREGLLRLNATHLRILPEPSTVRRRPPRTSGNGAGGGSGPGAAELVWALEDLQALQTSSSTVQFSPADGGVVLLEFINDSPRRWEDLLRSALRKRWKALGWGMIVEFQPRLRAR